MSARFVVVQSRRLRLMGLSSLGLATVFSCSVFPDHATLSPLEGSGGDSVAGADSVSHAGDGAGAPAAAGGGGTTSGGGAPAAAGVGGELVGGDAGAGGAAPAPCVNLEQQRVTTTADTWIDAAKPKNGHGAETTLSVVAGAAERRALLGFMLPAVPTGKALNRARLVLHLETNADVNLEARRLGLHQLTQEVSEPSATWLNFDNGNMGKWASAGGDYGAELAAVMLPVGMSNGSVTFELSEPARQLISTRPIPLWLIVLEKSSPATAPAELAFASREGDASSIPALILDYCDP